MKLRINELRGKREDNGQSHTWNEISVETGISKETLIALAGDGMRMLHPVYIDILCEYFGVDPSGLIVAERVALPHKLNLRPDRHGKSPNPKVPKTPAPSIAAQLRSTQRDGLTPAGAQPAAQPRTRVTVEEIERLRRERNGGGQ